MSRTVRVSTKSCDMPCRPSQSPGPTGMRERVAFRPTIPHSDAGIRIDPPPSVPWAIGSARAATRAAAPPLEPPTLRSRSHGLHVGPWTIGSVVALKANSGARVRPMTRKPAARIRCPRCVSAGQRTPSPVRRLPAWTICPSRWGATSFMSIGMPAKGPSLEASKADS